MPHKKSHCKDCKIKLLSALKEIDQDAQEQYSITLPANPKLYPSHVQKIHNHLIEQSKNDGRGPDKKALASKIMPFDYFLPKYESFLEFDEQQHFTLARYESLKLYPQNSSLGFNKEKWMDLCQRLKRKDNDPPYRNEQRAWLDTVRDLGPHCSGANFDKHEYFKPTVRIYEGDMAYCQTPTKELIHYIGDSIIK